MEHHSHAQETTQSLPQKGGSQQKNWRTERIFSASKACAFCGNLFTPWIKRDEAGKMLSACPEPTWKKQETCSLSCAKKLKNPMSNNQTRQRLREKLREIKHRPIKRGGNGQLLPLPQLALLHALGEGWESELPVRTMTGSGSGYPSHYKIDIANITMMIGIELDGGSHCSLERREQDARKTELLSSLGWSIYRVSNQEALRLYSTFESVDTLLISLTGR